MPDLSYAREFTAEEIKEIVAQANRTGKIIAEVLVSVYFGRKRINLMDLDTLDHRSFSMANSIIRYRRTYGWNDQEFFALTCFASAKHNIKI